MDPSCDLNVAFERTYPTPYATSPLLPLLLLSLASQKHSPDTKCDFRDEYDYIVVGAGSAGSVVASRLSEVPCVSVLLLEAGPPPPRLTDIPAIAENYFNTDIDWSYHTTPQKHTAAGMKDRKVPLQGGKTLGGSSTLNAILYTRGNRRNYDEWAAMGAEGWSYEEVLPYFLKLEDYTDSGYLEDREYHASGGPITVSRHVYITEQEMAETEAVINEGYDFVDPNAREQIGFYDYEQTARYGQRCSTAKAYLVPCENRPNLDIVTNAMVRKVLFENKCAIGVELDHKGLRRRVTTTKEVIVSAGTINTAQLLMLSGIGPMSELKKHHIPLVADLPVGLNFYDHPAAETIFEVDCSLPRYVEEVGKESNIMEYINSKTGVLTTSQGVQLMSFLSNPDSEMDCVPDHTVYFGDFTRFKGLNKTFIACHTQLLHTYSVGTVSLHSTDPYDKPEIDPNYLADFRDIHDMVEGIKTCNEIMRNPALKRIGAKPYGDPIPGCEEFACDEDLYLRCLVRTKIHTTNHFVGTARMGHPEDPRTVVDPQLRVKGVERLRVVDASIMPTIPWTNTNIPAIMVAEKASDMIKSTIECDCDPTNNWETS